MTLWGYTMWEKRRWFVSLRLTKRGKFVSDVINLLSNSSKVCDVLGLQSKSCGEFPLGRLLCDGDGFKWWVYQNVEAPFKRGTPNALFTLHDLPRRRHTGPFTLRDSDCDRDSWVFTLQDSSVMGALATPFSPSGGVTGCQSPLTEVQKDRIIVRNVCTLNQRCI